MRERLEQWRRRWRWFDVAMAVQERYSASEGGTTAGALTLALFLSLFPLLIVGTAVVGFVATKQDDFTNHLINQLGIQGEAATTVRESVNAASAHRHAASILGFLGLVWAGLGVVAAMQTMIDHAWGAKGRGLRDRAIAVVWLVTTGLGMAATFFLTGVLTVLPWWAAPVGVAVTVATTVGIFLWTYWLLGSRDVGWRPHMPGATFAGLAMQVLTVVGAFYVPRAAASSSGLYGSIGVVFAIIAWLFIFGRLMVYSTVLNVVLYERAHREDVAGLPYPGEEWRPSPKPVTREVTVSTSPTRPSETATSPSSPSRPSSRTSS